MCYNDYANKTTTHIHTQRKGEIHMFLTGKDLFMYRFNKAMEFAGAFVTTLATVTTLISMFVLFN
jgi:hypothetical protein